MIKLWRILSILSVVLFLFFVTADVAMAHERRTVDKYQMVVGWMVEPALEGLKNGVDLRVTSNDTSGTTQPVLGLEKTLKCEISYVATGVSKTFNLRTIYNDPGHYTTDLILNESGVYRMRFFGNIENTSVNETFNSEGGGGGYGDVEPSTDIQFPDQVAQVREVQAVAGAAQQAALRAQETASASKNITYVGVALGAVGVVLGGWALATNLRKR